MSKIRKEKKGMTYAQAVARMEGSNERRTQQQPEEMVTRTERGIYMDRKKFLAFIAMVINCALEIQGKSERIKMILDAAKRFLDVHDVSGEDLDNVLRDGFTATQTGSGT